MEIRKVSEGADMTIYISGRLDAVTAFELDKDLSASLDAVENLTIDLKDLEYISSAGLRTLLKLQKRMDTQGSMKICNVKKDVQDVLDMTGFSKFLTITDEKKSQFYVSF
ncbi:MAG: STAS domain-containing protein [Selenomonadaceae bacterium]|nr:STAS domain-containing protein [Selenomonadaceae bacterium]